MPQDDLANVVADLAAPVLQRFYGKYRGTVSDTDDPEGLGRIKARVPEVMAEVESPWAMACTPYPGMGEGLYAIPPVGAGVWIEFEAGDPSRPIWTGGWFGRSDSPRDETGKTPDPALKVLRTGQGLLLAFDDDAKTIALSDGDGANLLKIKVNGGQLQLRAAAKIIVEAPQIELVEGASHPLVFGDDLLQYLGQIASTFNAHAHVGETVLGIPVTPMVPTPPFQPPSPSMLSLKAKTG